MKKLLTIICLTLFLSKSYSQAEESKPKNEIKVNVPYLLAGMPEITFERILNGETAFGISASFSTEDDAYLKFIVTPYYRLYFGKKEAAGFFIEGNGAIYSEEEYNHLLLNNSDTRNHTKMGAGLGIAIGVKLLNKSNWVGEIYAGAGRNFSNRDKISASYPRVGINVGKRF